MTLNEWRIKHKYKGTPRSRTKEVKIYITSDDPARAELLLLTDYKIKSRFGEILTFVPRTIQDLLYEFRDYVDECIANSANQVVHPVSFDEWYQKTYHCPTCL